MNAYENLLTEQELADVIRYQWNSKRAAVKSLFGIWNNYLENIPTNPEHFSLEDLEVTTKAILALLETFEELNEFAMAMKTDNLMFRTDEYAIDRAKN